MILEQLAIDIKNYSGPLSYTVNTQTLNGLKTCKLKEKL